MRERESGHVFIGQAKIPYSIRRSVRRRRSIGLLVGHGGEIRILAPARAGLAAIERLILRQSNWIGKRLENVNRRRELYPMLRPEPGGHVPYRGENLVLRVTEHGDQPQGCAVEGGDLVVNLPKTEPRSSALAGEVRRGVLSTNTKNSASGDNLTPDPALIRLRQGFGGQEGRGTPCAATAADIREEIRLEIMLWYKKRARIVFRDCVAQWGEITGLRPRRVTVSNARRQWGSCSAGNDVRLNWRLVTAPPPLLDYVIVHELCHIAHKNHSQRFWDLVERYIPDCRARRRELRGLDPGFGMDGD
jgi:predicted metal-dependent hydrolase